MRLPIQTLQRITLQVEGEDAETWHPSMIVDFSDGNELVISPLSGREDDAPLPPGTNLRVEIHLPDGIRAFTSALKRVDAIGAWHLTWPTETKRIQRRDFVRVDVEMQADIRVFGKVEGVPTHVKGTTADLSAGGMRLHLPVELPEGTIIGIELHTKMGTLDFLARVLRTIPLEQTPGQKYQFWSGVEFTEIAESVRKVLVNLVFEIQRDMLRRV